MDLIVTSERYRMAILIGHNCKLILVYFNFLDSLLIIVVVVIKVQKVNQMMRTI
jgi:hypothetical protein